MGNKALINKNDITYNKASGIHVMSSASAIIINNSISTNIFQGVLVQENSSAHIERNDISSNIKANIGLGGDESCNTSIINNKILNGRCEGIFMIDCGKALITRNTIKDNYYGIMVITSIPIIENNEIIENKHHGILLLKKSRAVLTKNIIKENKGVGVFVRDHSCTLMTGCTIAENHLGFVQERKYNPNKFRQSNKDNIKEELSEEKKRREKQEAIALDGENEFHGIDISKYHGGNFKHVTEKFTKKVSMKKKADPWAMEDLKVNNEIEDIIRVPFEVKCNLI